MSRFLSDTKKALKPYVPGEQPKEKKLIKLNTNENPYPPSPLAVSLLAGSQVKELSMPDEIANLRLYSDPETGALIEAIAEFYGVETNQVIVGNGSDEILAFAVLAFCDAHTPLCFPDLTYGFYAVHCGLFGIPTKVIPLDENFAIQVDDYKDCDGCIMIANPNAPTSLALPLSEIERLLLQNPGRLVIVDEAYVDFGSKSAVTLLDRYENLVVIQTFSKSRSLAGGRVGFAIAAPALIEDLNRMKFSFNPYNVNRLSLLAATGAMKDRSYFESCVSRICATRDKTVEKLKALGFTVLPSKTNFLFAKSHLMTGAEYAEGLRCHGILIRRWDTPRIEDYLRISIGSDQEMEEFLDITEQLLREKEGKA